MFGLFENYSETAQATVLNARKHYMGGQRMPGYEFILEVQPATGEAFRTAIKYYNSVPILPPQAGAVLTVRYNPKKRSVKLDLKGDPRYDLTMLSNAISQEQKEQRANLLSSSPGMPTPQSESVSAQILLQMMRDRSPKKPE